MRQTTPKQWYWSHHTNEFIGFSHVGGNKGPFDTLAEAKQSARLTFEEHLRLARESLAVIRTFRARDQDSSY